MTMDDRDLDREWKPSGRPQSTIARNFMSELDDLFKIDGGLDEMHNKLHEKKQVVSTHASELEALEARLREAEERLKQAKSSPPSGTSKESQRRIPVHSAFPPNAEQGMEGDPASPTPARRRPEESYVQGRPNPAQQDESRTP